MGLSGRGVATCLIARSRNAVAEHSRLLGGDAASKWRNIPKRLEYSKCYMHVP